MKGIFTNPEKRSKLIREKLKGKPKPEGFGKLISEKEKGKKLSESHKINVIEATRKRVKEGTHNFLSKNRSFKSWNRVDGKSNKRKRNREEVIRVWCESNRIHRVPDGCMIHHINQDTNDNKPENLQLMDKRFHNQLHNENFRLLRLGEKKIGM
jgi:hypothetical protein